MEDCKYEKEITRIVRILDGNGHDGLIRQVTGHNIKINDMCENIEKLATAYSALAKNDSNKEAVRKALGKALVNTSLIVGIFSTIITLLIVLL